MGNKKGLSMYWIDNPGTLNTTFKSIFTIAKSALNVKSER